MAKQNQKPASKKAEIKEKKAPAKKQYWVSPMMIRGVGVVSGEVDRAHVAKFESYSTAEVKDYIIDYDPVEKELSQRRKKMREKLGFKD